MHVVSPQVVGVVCAVLIVFGTWWMWQSYPSNAGPALPELQVLNDRTIVDFAYNPDGTVAYSYLAEKVPDMLAENEVTELRNETSYTKFIEVVTPGDDPTVKLETRIYSQPAYAQDADGSWKYLEYATTTEQAFRNRDMSLGKYLTEFFVRSAYADTVSPFSGAGDGFVGHVDAVSWSEIRSAATGSVGSDASNLQVFTRNQTNIFGHIYRAFLPFDTSSVPANATISSASLSIYPTSLTVSNNDGLDYLSIFQTSQATHTSLGFSDYDQCGGTSPTEGIDSGERKDLSSASASTYMTFTLNSTGRGWIKKAGESSNCTDTAGITCLGIREGHDIENSLPSASSGNFVAISASEQSGTSQDPYLTITYTAVAPEKMRIQLNSGRFQINGGRFKLQSN